MATTIGYARVSTMTQITDGDGLEAQRARIVAWCAYQGLPLDGIEEDAGISGASTDNRPGFRTAVRRALEGGAGSVFVVYKLDRLGRNAIDVQETLAVLLAAGVRVVALADGVDSASGMGAALLKLLTSILATFAELEKEAIVSRLQDGRKHAKARGRVYSREAAYGSRNGENGSLVADDDERRAVDRVRELRAQGLSLRAIGERLMSEGIRPRRASKWSPAVVLRLATGKRTPAKSKQSARIAKATADFLTRPAA
jgi:DNA invertase Pin-like site-specific DNA recombinase